MTTADALDLADYDYELPPALIAQRPTPERDEARLLVLDRSHAELAHAHVSELPDWLRAGDLLVVNTTRVVPARLRGEKTSGGRVEALLLGAGSTPHSWRALLRARQRVGQRLRFGQGALAFEARVAALLGDGEVLLETEPSVDPYRAGEAPLPPYIRRAGACAEDLERYQTVFAREPGAVAAPTAGLHLSERLLAALRQAGIELAEVVLHVGVGTFRPLREEDLASGQLHAERYELPESSAGAIDRARARGGRVVAIGTTSARVLETCACGGGRVHAARGETRLFLRPGSRLAVVDALFTNFHLPRSSLLLLVAAFAGRETLLDAYAEAIAARYRFYSYGDAMLIV